MALLNSFPFPFSDPIAAPKRTDEYKYPERDPEEGKCTKPWVDAFTAWTGNMEKVPGRVGHVFLTNQDASIGATAIIPGDLSSGFYRVLYEVRISTPDGLASSIQVNFDWKWLGVSGTFTGTANTNNSASTPTSQTFGLRLDQLQGLRYSTVFSRTTGDGLYDLDIFVEEIQA